MTTYHFAQAAYPLDAGDFADPRHPLIARPTPVFGLDSQSSIEWKTPSLDEQVGWASLRCTDCPSLQGDLLRKAWLDALTARVTSVPFVVVDAARHRAEPGMLHGLVVQAPPRSHTTPAQAMAAELRSLSALTNEEIAPLLGVSRRSLQAWIAGGAISARKEGRLRAVLETVRTLADAAPSTTRDRILRRPSSHAVRPYDLIAEQRFDAAIDAALGRTPRQTVSQVRTTEPIDVQLGRIEESIPAPSARVDRRLSRPLRR